MMKESICPHSASNTVVPAYQHHPGNLIVNRNEETTQVIKFNVTDIERYNNTMFLSAVENNDCCGSHFSP